MEIDYVKVSAEGELGRDLVSEAIGGEVEYGEVDEELQGIRDGPGEEIGGEVEGLEVGAVGEVGGDCAAEGEVWERELVDSAVVTGDTLEVGVEAAAGGGEGGLSPVFEVLVWVLEGRTQVAQAGFIVWICCTSSNVATC